MSSIASKEKVLQFSEIRKNFGGLAALDGVSLAIDEGTITVVIGPNGSGKTTLINVLTGFYRPDAGAITYKGTDITGINPHDLCKMGIVRTFQIPALFWRLTVLENLLVSESSNPGESFFKALMTRAWFRKETESQERAARILELLGLTSVWNLPASTLSGGQMKLLEIGRALMVGAKVLVLDEPISGVNPTLANQIFAKLRNLKTEENLTFLIVEHRLDIALRYADYVIAMSNGKLLSSGTPDEVVNEAAVIEAYLGGA